MEEAVARAQLTASVGEDLVHATPGAIAGFIQPPTTASSPVSGPWLPRSRTCKRWKLVRELCMVIGSSSAVLVDSSSVSLPPSTCTVRNRQSSRS